MAAVYLARDERLDRLVAVKRLHAESPEDAARRFAREAKLGASLNHPNIVVVFDAVADEDGVLIVMEYVPGTTLARELEAGPLPVDRAIEVVTGVAAALDHAHDHGVVHRDVKPSNVLLGERGIVKLGDLGVATAAEHTRITRSGAVLGTPAYMAPEQLDGGRTSPASDRYSLAAVAFEALSGRRARTGRTPVALALAAATEPPPDLREAWSKAPPEAAEVLKRGMARERSDRYSSAGEMATELAAALAGAEGPPAAPAAFPLPAPAPVPPRPPAAPAILASPLPRPDRGGRRWRPPPPLLPLVLVAGAVLLGAILLLSTGGGDNGAPNRADKAKPRATTPHAAKRPKGKKQGSAPSTAGSGPAGPAPASPVRPSGAADGARLNDQGFRLMRAGRYAEAVPILRRAVAAYRSGTTDLGYAYALFNLGRSLRLSGHPAEAIPILERRLRIPNQTSEVEHELAAARRQARRG